MAGTFLRMAIIQNPKLSDLLLLVGFLALPLSLGELVTPAMADFLGKYYFQACVLKCLLEMLSERLAPWRLFNFDKTKINKYEKNSNGILI